MPFDFEKNNVVDSLDAVPENYRGVYTEVADGENAGKFVVNESFQGLVGDYVGTTKALEKARADKTNASNESATRRVALKAFNEIMESLGIDEESRTAEGLKAHIDEIAALAKNGKELKINLDKVRAEMAKQHAAEMEGKDKAIAERDSALSNHLIGDVATRALSSEKGAVDLLLPHVRSNSKVVRAEDGSYAVRVLDEAGEVRYNGAGQPMTVEDFVKSMKADPKFARGFESEALPGSGSTPGMTQRTQTNRGTVDKSSNAKIADGLKNLKAGRAV